MEKSPTKDLAAASSNPRGSKSVAGQVTSERDPEAAKKPKQDLSEEELRRLEKVRKIMFDLAKTVRSYTIYNQNNDQIRQFIQVLYDSLKEFLDQEESILSLRIRPEAAYYFEELVYENSNPEESIAVKLHKDGIKEIVFQKGIEKKELVDFISILNINLDSPEYFDQDVVSLMWERDFENISYFVIEGLSDNIEPSKKEQIEEDIELILSLVHSDKPPERALRSAHLSKDDLYQYFQQDNLEAAKADILKEQDAFKSHFIVSDDQIRKIRDEMEKISDADMIFQMVEIIVNLLKKELDQENFMAIGDVLTQVVDMMLLRADFVNATHIIKSLREMVVSGGAAQAQKDDRMVVEGSMVKVDFHEKVRAAKWVEDIIEKIGHEQRMEQVVAALNQGYKGKPTDIFDYLISLNASAVNPLLTLLGDVGKLGHRRLICDAILIIHNGDVTNFARKLYDEHWFVVSDMLYILGKIGHSDALTYMMKAYEHENPKVRAESLAALRRFPMDKVREVFIRALKDENLQVQLEALRTLAYYKDHGAVDDILSVIESKDFFDFPSNVKRRFFTTLATIEGTSMVSYLIRAVRKNRFWLGGINSDIRASAAYALGVVGSVEALQVLKRYQKAFSRELRNACKEALQRSKMAGQGPGSGLILEPLNQQKMKDKKGSDLILEPLSD